MSRKKPTRKQLNRPEPSPILTPPEPRQVEPEPQVEESAPIADTKPDEAESVSVPIEENAPRTELNPPSPPRQHPPSPPRQHPASLALEQVSNAQGEAFSLGDKIRVRAPWGGTATVEIAKFYQDGTGDIWVQYNALDSQPDWSWEGGFALAAVLVKA
ncbi:MAG: hypothetical protein LDL41_20075 [Coleofasciculus sp. S288]|nr:hypothetical protein [Coleofasciculus sp. S288]